jgi:hypothetical protein
MDVKRSVYGSIILLHYRLLLIPVSIPEFPLSSERYMTNVYFPLGRGEEKIAGGHETLFGFHPGHHGKRIFAGIGLVSAKRTFSVLSP